MFTSFHLANSNYLLFFNTNSEYYIIYLNVFGLNVCLCVLNISKIYIKCFYNVH